MMNPENEIEDIRGPPFVPYSSLFNQLWSLGSQLFPKKLEERIIELYIGDISKVSKILRREILLKYILYNLQILDSVILMVN